MWYGASMAASEINNNGGINVGGLGTNYTINLLEVDTTKFLNVSAAMQYAINTSGAQFVIGGWEPSDVAAMIPVAMATQTPFFIDGTPTSSLLAGTTPYSNGNSTMLGDGTPYYPYKPSSAGYEYIFRGAHMADIFSVNNAFLLTTMVAKKIENIICANATNPVKFAILAENLSSLDWPVWWARNVFGDVAPNQFGWPWELAPAVGNNGTGVWRVAPDATVDVMDNDLNAIKASGAHVIFTIFLGPEGVTFGMEKGRLQVPAIAVGINVESWFPDYWAETNYGPGLYGADYEVTIGMWAPGVNQTDKTAAFLSAFSTAYHTLPSYTAASYDILYGLKAAFQGVGSVADTGGIIAWLENPANAQVRTTGLATYYPKWDGTTTSWWPALNSTQRDYYYNNSPAHLIGYSDSGLNFGLNFTMPPYTTHDIVYGPTWVSGIGIQWQSGVQIGVWPNNGTWTDQNMISRLFAGINWTDVQYPGTTNFTIPEWMCSAWTGLPCSSPCPH
jgi:branched-chain amino acid transport system substrate-binding protein